MLEFYDSDKRFACRKTFKCVCFSTIKVGIGNFETTEEDLHVYTKFSWPNSFAIKSELRSF